MKRTLDDRLGVVALEHRAPRGVVLRLAQLDDEAVEAAARDREVAHGVVLGAVRDRVRGAAGDEDEPADVDVLLAVRREQVAVPSST